MKGFKFILFIALACLLVLPFSVFAAEETETATDTDNKEVKLYFFRGEGCSHCAEFEEWLSEIEPEYGNLFEVIDYETWNDEKNAELMQKVAKVRGEKAEGVPYIIIGNKSWNGFADDYKEEILIQIQQEYETNPTERYDIMTLLPKEKAEKTGAGDVISLIVVLLVSGLVVVGIVKARKSTN